jgi:hypothetical protein
MARPFEFSPTTRFQARLRQKGMCACCGDELRDVLEHGHHVIPNQSGQPGNPKHAWLSSTENCVVLCAQCHERVHQDARYRAGGVAPPSYYPHSHGGNQAAHQAWSGGLEGRARLLWG